MIFHFHGGIIFQGGLFSGLPKIPGLQHIAETIFLNLTFGDILECTQVNESWKMIVANPSFWLRKCAQNSTFENISAWRKLIQLTKETIFEKNCPCIYKHVQRTCIWGGGGMST